MIPPLGSSTFPRLIEEARTRKPPTAGEWIEPLKGKQVIVVETD